VSGSGLLVASVNLLQEGLDEVTLFLGGGVDGGSSGGLGLGATTGGGPGTSEDRAESGHGEDVGADLLAGDLVVDDHLE